MALSALHLLQGLAPSHCIQVRGNTSVTSKDRAYLRLLEAASVASFTDTLSDVVV